MCVCVCSPGPHSQGLLRLGGCLWVKLELTGAGGSRRSAWLLSAHTDLPLSTPGWGAPSTASSSSSVLTLLLIRMKLSAHLAALLLLRSRPPPHTAPHSLGCFPFFCEPRHDVSESGTPSMGLALGGPGGWSSVQRCSGFENSPRHTWSRGSCEAAPGASPAPLSGLLPHDGRGAPQWCGEQAPVPQQLVEVREAV